MPSERVQRQIDRLLDEAEQASAEQGWDVVKERAEHVLAFDLDNADARALLAAAERGLGQAEMPAPPKAPAVEQPTSFAGGRYEVRRFLGEGGKKRVLAFVEAIRTYVLARDADDLKRDLGTGAAEVARIVSEVRAQRDAESVAR